MESACLMNVPEAELLKRALDQERALNERLIAQLNYMLELADAKQERLADATSFIYGLKTPEAEAFLDSQPLTDL